MPGTAPGSPPSPSGITTPPSRISRRRSRSSRITRARSSASARRSRGAQDAEAEAAFAKAQTAIDALRRGGRSTEATLAHAFLHATNGRPTEALQCLRTLLESPTCPSADGPSRSNPSCAPYIRSPDSRKSSRPCPPAPDSARRTSHAARVVGLSLFHPFSAALTTPEPAGRYRAPYHAYDPQTTCSALLLFAFLTPAAPAAAQTTSPAAQVDRRRYRSARARAPRRLAPVSGPSRVRTMPKSSSAPMPVPP